MKNPRQLSRLMLERGWRHPSRGSDVSKSGAQDDVVVPLDAAENLSSTCRFPRVPLDE